jgi:hypothetical protein
VTQTLADNDCIEIKRPFRESTRLTVAEYDDGIRRSRSIRTIAALSYEGLLWSRGAPPVETLTRDGYEAEDGLVRVTDPEAYDLQMRKLLGIL